MTIETRFDRDDESQAWRRWKKNHNLRVSFFIRVPESYNVEFRSGAGNIEIADLNGSIEGRTGAGNVTLYVDDSVGADVTARSSMGSARTDYDLRVRGKWMSKSFSGEINGGGPEISISSGVGNVTLRRN